MRLAILSDIHGNLLALQAVLVDLKQAGGADRTWVLGDLCAFGPRPAECLQQVCELPEVEAIRGNTDRYVIAGQRPPFAFVPRGLVTRPQDEAEWERMREQFQERDANFNWTAFRLSFGDCDTLAGLRGELELEMPGYGRVIGYHGTPGDDEGVMLPETPDGELLARMACRKGRLGFGGHTHRAMDRSVGSWRVVNVGSVGMPADERRACYALVTFTNGAAHIELRRVGYDLEATITDLRQQGNPAWQWFAEHLRRARD